MEIFDSHTHINATEFKNDIPDVIERAQALDVTEMLVISYDTPSTERMLDLVEKYPNIYGAFGCHPELQLPISIHDRDAIADCYAILKEADIAKIGGIMHSFNGDADWAEKFLDLGLELSFSGVVTFGNAKEVKQAALMTPLEHMLVETDAPYLTPMPFRGKINEPAMTRYTLEFLAKERGL